MVPQIISEPIQRLLAATAKYLCEKHGGLPAGVVLALRQAHPQAGHFEKRLDAAALEGKEAEVTTICREYCRWWNGIIAEYSRTQ